MHVFEPFSETCIVFLRKRYTLQKNPYLCLAKRQNCVKLGMKEKTQVIFGTFLN